MSQFDIYISFAKEDNKPLEGTESGWVTYFQEFLAQILQKLLHRKPVFLYLPNNENPSKEQIQQTKLLICIVSPAFTASSYCIEDIHLFANSNLGKIFKVVKESVSNAQEPSDLQRLPSYFFSKKSAETKSYSSSDQFFNEEAEKHFWLMLMDLAHDVAAELRENAERKLIQDAEMPIVYLAETNSEYLIEKHHIKRELERQGCKVLPAQSYPSNLKELEVFIKGNIEESNISIHLVGDSNSANTSKTELIIQELENRIAAENSSHTSAPGLLANSGSSTGRFQRFIWISPELKKNEERQKSFVENYLRNGESMEGAEILQTPIEDFKFLIKKVINQRPLTTTETSSVSKNSLYLLYDKIDSKEGQRLAEYLGEQGFDVLKPVFTGSLTKIRRNHIENLTYCDAAIIHHGKVSEQWIKMKCLDLLKSPGFGRKKPLVAKALYTKNSININLAFYKTYDIEIVEQTDDALLENFKPFLNKIGG